MNSGRSRSAVMSLPRDRRSVIWRSAKLVLFGVFYLFMGGACARTAFRLTSASAMQSLLWGVFAAIAILLAIAHLVLAPLVWKVPFAIYDGGMDLGPTSLAWDQVSSCYWNRYIPSVLIIRTGFRARLFVTVPGDRRAEVEAALRGAGKWQSW